MLQITTLFFGHEGEINMRIWIFRLAYHTDIFVTLILIYSSMDGN
jgi:hypothetical protein